MARSILVIGDSISLAHVARAIVVARRLQAEGAKVVFATGAWHQQLAAQEGFEPRELFSVDPERAIAAVQRGSHVFDFETVRRYVESDRELIKDVKPDLVIGDFRLSLGISAELAGVEWWSIVNGYMTRFYAAPEKPPETHPLLRRLGRRLGGRLYPWLKPLALRYFFAWNFNRYRRRAGLKPVRDVLDCIASERRSLIADLPEFAPCANLPPHFDYVGPLVWEPKMAPPDWLDKLDPAKPTVYVTMGSTGCAGDFRQALETLSGGGYQVLTTTGRHATSLPKGVFAAEFAPGSALLKRSQAVVCHGGNLTIYQAIHEGVPIVGIPTWHDQEINLDRVEALGWGVQLRPFRWTPQELLKAVERVRQGDYQERAAKGRERTRTAIAESISRPLIAEAPAAPRG